MHAAGRYEVGLVSKQRLKNREGKNQIFWFWAGQHSKSIGQYVLSDPSLLVHLFS